MLQPPINCPIVRVPEVVPCDQSELDQLVSFLESDASIEETKTFTRGTLLPDGRLDLCKQSVGPRGCARLTNALSNNSQVKSVLLGTDAIGDEGARSVARLIESNSNLEVVYLGCNGISARGAEVLARVLEHNTTVKGLWLKRNPIGDEGVHALAQMLRSNTTLENLDVVNCGFSSASFASLCAILRDENRTLKRFYAGGNGLNELSSAPVGEVVHANPTLQGLYLNVNALGNEGAAQLAYGLKANVALCELGLGSNGIERAGLSTLAEAVSDHPTLESLDLGRAASQTVLGAKANNFSHCGDLLALMLRQNQSLRRLNLRGTRLSGGDFEAIFDTAIDHPCLVELAVDAPLRADVKERLSSNRSQHGVWSGDAGVALIKSVYRTKEKAS